MSSTQRFHSSRRHQSTWLRLVGGLFVSLGLTVSSVLLHGAEPSQATLGPGPGDTKEVTWVGTAPGGVSPGPQLGDHDGFCEEGVNCEHFVLNLADGDWTNKQVRILFRWNSIATDYDVYVHKGSPGGEVADDSAAGPTNFEQVELDPAEHGTGAFHVHVVYFAATAADQYRATATVVAKGAGLPHAPVAAVTPPRYQTHTPTEAQFAAGMTRNLQDEPNIGVNWKTGSVMFQTLLQTHRVTFSDTCSQTPSSSWTDVSPPTAVNSFDPILHTDRDTGRTFVSHLLLNPLASLSAVTDDDGASWVPSQGAGVGSGIDHQTIGSGPFSSYAVKPPGAFGSAVYYCAQDIAFANCALSVDGGITYGPAMPMYDLQQCDGLHGHVKVAPDGTVYVPNASCVGERNPRENGVAFSRDNGITWSVRTVPGSVSGGGSDPSVAVDEGGRVYLGFVDDDKNPAVAAWNNQTERWEHVYDVGAMVGVKHAVFPAMVAGSAGRAAMAFYGTSSTTNVNRFDGAGEWYLYVAHTYDGGASWITVNATPDDPLQRGGVHLGGGSDIHRNLLDFFDADVDAQGRMIVGYADGCVGACAQAGPESRGNSYTAHGKIARQTGGMGLYPTFDPPAMTAPGAPYVTVTRNGSVARVTWSQSEDGGAPISTYRIFRGSGEGSEALVGTVSGAAREFVDQSGDPRATYKYRVVAVNAAGASCGDNSATGPAAGSSCSGVGLRVASDALNDHRTAVLGGDRDMDIESLSIGERAGKLAFTMKVADLAKMPPNRMWRILWHFPNAPLTPATVSGFVGRYYIGMNTDASGVPSFEYGIVRSVSAVVANALPPFRLSDGTRVVEGTVSPDGTITMLVEPAWVGNPAAGDLLGAITGRAFPVRQHQTLRGDTAADSVVHSATYALVGSAYCANEPPTVNCVEEAASQVTYSNGWHTVSAGNASGGSFRLKPGSGGSLKFTFDVLEGATRGALTYHYATSTKGGSAEVFIDGVSQGVISFAGASGGLKTPVFGANRRFDNLAPGAHTFELRNISGAAYVDRFCFESSFASGTAASSSQTSTATALVAATDALVRGFSVPSGTQAISIVAAADAAISLVLIDPAGAIVETVDAQDGVAVIEREVTQAGTYQVKVVNTGLAPVEVWTASTSWKQRQ